jgi:hypothetical protein
MRAEWNVSSATTTRHAELVSASIFPHALSMFVALWTLNRKVSEAKQVQGDEHINASALGN